MEQKEGRGCHEPRPDDSRMMFRLRGLPLYCATTFLGAENSEVLPPGPVAVAVMFCPSLIALVVEKLNETLPDPSVETLLEPSSVLPSSVPSGLEKNWTLKVLSGV